MGSLKTIHRIPSSAAWPMQIGAMMVILTPLAAAMPLAASAVPPPQVSTTIQHKTLAQPELLRQVPPVLRQRTLTPRDSAALRNLRLRMSDADFGAAVRTLKLGSEPISFTTGTLITPIAHRQSAVGSKGAREAYRLPESHVQITQDGVSRALDVYLQASPFRFTSSSRSFDAQLDVWVEDPAEPGVAVDLSSPVAVQVLASGASAEPPTASVVRSGIPTTPIHLTDPDAIDSVSLRVVTSEHPNGLPLTVAVQPTAEVRTSADTIQGWGLEAVAMTVTVRGSTRVPPTPVGVLARPGSASVDSVTVSSSRPATFRVRSGRPGPAQVEVTSATLNGAVPVYFAFPVRFFIFAGIGAVVGSLLGMGKGDGGTGSTRARLLSIIKGILAGFVVTVAYMVLGLGLLPVKLPASASFNEGLVFAVTALGSFSWLKGALVIQGWGRSTEDGKATE